MSESLLNGLYVVTGARSGIGLEICKNILHHGGEIIAVIRNEEGAKQFHSEVEDFQDKVLVEYADLNISSEVADLLKRIKSSHKAIEGLVNCAGVVQYEMFRMFSDSRMEEMLNVNVVAPLTLMRGLFPLLRKGKQRSIVNISSAVSIQGVSGQLVYSTTKGAVNSMTLSASKEFGPSGIRVNAIAPGIIESERLLSMMKEKFGEKEYRTSLGRYGEPREIAECCTFLLSSKASYITGQIISVDGGLSL